MTDVVATRGGTWRRIAARSSAILVALWLVWFAPLAFVSYWWRSSNPVTGRALHVRQRMADWPVMTHSLNGKSYAQVVALLGAPRTDDKFRDAGLVYVLARERGFISIDFEWLLLTLGKAGTVENAAVIADRCRTTASSAGVNHERKSSGLGAPGARAER